MLEVSCRAVDLLISCAEKNGVDPSALAEGLPVSLAHLRDSNARIDWEVYRTLISRVAPLCPRPEDWRALGKTFIDGQNIHGFVSLLRLLVKPRQMMKWTFRYGGFRLFSNMTSEVREVDGDLLLTL